MSYSQHPGYGGYYGNSSTSQNNNAGYGEGRDTAGESAYGHQQLYQNTAQENQYGSNQYDWSSHNQQGYSDPGAHSIANTTWQNGDAHSGSYEYRRQGTEQNAQYTSNNENQMAVQQNNWPGTTNRSQGLNQLAYASGLDSQRPATSQSHGYPSSNVTAASTATASRAKSPAYKGTYQGAKQWTSSQAMQKEDSSGSTHLAMSAAAALAGAVNRRNQNSQTNAAQNATAAAGLTQKAVATPPMRTKSPYTTVPPRPNSSRADGRTQQVPKSNNSVPHPPTTHNSVSADVRPPSVQQNRPTTNQQFSLPNSTQSAPKSRSILNTYPVSESVRKTMQLPEPEVPVPVPAPAVTYIDPTQVFNPYHHEHERRKREQAAAAEAEAEAKRLADIQAQKEATEAAETAKRKEAEARANPGQNDAPSVPKPKPRKRQKVKGAAPDITAPIAQDGSLSNASDIALEMKKMMEKMQELRNKDPTLFQKMLETSGGDLGVTLTSPPPKTNQAAKPTADAVPFKVAGGNMNGWRVVVENNVEGLPDLGRFPAERRVRPRKSDIGEKGAVTGTIPDTTNVGRNSQATTNALYLANSSTNPQPVPVSNRAPAPSTSPTQGGTVWPEERRKTLAEVAVRTLKANPENASIVITVVDIQAILAKNPSYSELCEILEKRSLKFNRAQFARQLLSSMPDLTQQAKGAPAATGSIAQTIAASKSLSPPVLNAIITTGANTSQIMTQPLGGLAGITSPSLGVKKETGEGQAMLVKAAGSKARQSSGHKPSKGGPAPGSKEAMSRKRDFSEIVDLTNLSDTEDYVLSRKSVRIEMPPEPSNMLLPVQSPQPNTAFSSQSSLPGSFSTMQPPMNLTPLKFDPLPAAPQPKVRTPYVPPQKTLVSKDLDVEEGKAKTLYNPKTLARDILLAVGQHPSMHTLNDHLWPLCKNHIWLNHDLSTFDWEAVDPGGPSPPKVEIEEIPVAWPRTRTVQYQSGKNATRLDSEKRRYDAPAPGVDSVRGEHSHLHNAIPRIRSSSRLQQPDPNNTLSPAPSMSTIGIPRRGRPPGSKNRPKDPNATGASAPPAEESLQTPSNPVYKCKWRKCHAQLHNLPTLRQHVSKVHHPDEEQQTNEGGYVCWWRKCSSHVESNGVITPKEIFKTQDEWMQHINKEHIHEIGKKSGDGPSTKHIGKPMMTTDPNFMSRFAYVSTNNTKSNARDSAAQTDPHDINNDRRRYLSDELGRPVTVQVTNRMMKDLPSDTLELTNKIDDPTKKARKAFVKAHHMDKTTGKFGEAKANAQETLRAMEARKLKIGPGIDRSGCTFVNEARRSTFVQNPGISRIVDVNY